MRHIIFGCIFLLVNLSFVNIFCQGNLSQSWPEIDAPVPEFNLSNITDYKQASVTSRDLKGKYFILDFWNKNCTTCFQSFPKTNELQKKFHDQITFFLIGGENDTQDFYNKFKIKHNLKLPVVFDSLLYEKFVHMGVPFLVWVDDKGIVKALTSSSDLTSENLDLFIQGKPFHFSDYSYKNYLKRQRYNPAQPFLINDNGGDDSTEYLHRSILLRFTPQMANKLFAFSLEEQLSNTFYDKGLIEGVAGISGLYKFAYLGHNEWYYTDSLVYNSFYHKPLLQVSDLSKFSEDFRTGKNMYWYSLKVDPATANKNHVMKVMQNDLESTFGYKANVEVRRMPYFRIICKDPTKTKSKLKTKNSITSWKGDYTYYDGKNLSLSHFFNVMFGLIPAENLFQIADETGVDYNVDIQIDGLPVNSLADYKKILNKLGFDVIQGEKEFKVLVISDK